MNPLWEDNYFTVVGSVIGFLVNDLLSFLVNCSLTKCTVIRL